MSYVSEGWHGEVSCAWFQGFKVGQAELWSFEDSLTPMPSILWAGAPHGHEKGEFSRYISSFLGLSPCTCKEPRKMSISTGENEQRILPA